MRCVVTGGTGFLGNCLVKKLEAEGHQVTVVSRRSGHDVRRPETLGEAFRGAEAVFHLAALVQSRPGSFEATNLEGLGNVLDQSLRADVKRFVNVSSFTIFGPSGRFDHTEEAVPQRTQFFHGYDETKYRGFRLAQQWYSRLPLNTVFPTVIYGPGPMTEGNILVRLLRRWKKTRLAALQRWGQPVWNFVFVEDVADGLVRCLKSPPGEDFILGGDNESLRGLVKAFAREADCRIATLGLPDFLFRAGSHLEDWASRIAGFPPLVLPATAGFFLCDWQYSSQKAVNQIGYSPRSLREGLKLTYQWMQEERLV